MVSVNSSCKTTTNWRMRSSVSVSSFVMTKCLNTQHGHIRSTLVGDDDLSVLDQPSQIANDEQAAAINS